MTSSREVFLVWLALACLSQIVAGEIASHAEDGSLHASGPADEIAPESKRIQLKQSGLLPAFLWPLRKTKQPNIFLIFYDLYEPMMPQQIKDMVDQQIRPPTDQMSEQIFQRVTGAKQFYEYMNSFMQMFAQFGPQNFLGGGGGGSSSSSEGGNGLSNLMGGFIGRR